MDKRCKAEIAEALKHAGVAPNAINSTVQEIELCVSRFRTRKVSNEMRRREIEQEIEREQGGQQPAGESARAVTDRLLDQQ